MRDPDQWRQVGVHWHAYIEIRERGQCWDRSTRDVRLGSRPDVALGNPEGVAEWVAGMVREHVDPRTVHLLAPHPGVGKLGDSAHLDHERVENLNALSRGDSLYVDIPRQDDRMHLLCEAVTADQCQEVHHEQE